jgi:D-psicose/D-tagatose/L-ribulose 3-epimerase
MKVGVNTLIWTAAFGEEHLPLLPAIKAHGFDSVEIARFSWEGFPAAKIASALRDHGLGVSVCTAFTSPVNFCDAGPSNRSKAAAFIRQSIDFTAALGGSLLCGPMHCAVGALVGRRRTAGEWNWLADGLREVAPHAAAAGVTLAVEPLNRFETYVLNTAADAARLCDEVGSPAVGILYDTFHANIEEKSQAEAISACGRHIRHVHSCENDRGTPGSGHVEWVSVADSLRAAGYDGVWVIESFGFAIPEIAAAACIWRDIESSPDRIAWDGIRFLKQL